MTKSEVIRRVTEIRARKADDEMAHNLEDELYRDVLRAVATGACEEPAACAKLALGTQRIKFARDCA